MIYNFCTLFDSNYFSRGITLYKSLIDKNFEFHLYVFAFDDESYLKLKELNLTNLTVISLIDFEDDQMLKIKPDRTKAEYCWTSTPSTILYCFLKFKIDNCTYLDADLFFFNSPEILFEEIGYASVALTKHNYTKKYDQSKTSGIYCVQFVYFKNDKYGMNALNWWREKCLEWCFARLENGKFGDQKYLDDWTTRFDNVHVISNLGAGIAPWNVQQFNIQNNNNYILYQNDSKLEYPSIFYHYHNLNYQVKDTQVFISSSKFDLSQNVINIFYIPYIKKLLVEDGLDLINLNIKFHKYSMLIRIFNNIRLLLKRSEIFRKINIAFVKSSR